jgi:putative addiction module CopG family antidote
MHVKLPSAQEEFIEQKVACGVFPSPDAVISKAITLLQQQDLWTKEVADKIEQGWNEAQSGVLISEESLMRHLSARKAEWKANR